MTPQPNEPTAEAIDAALEAVFEECFNVNARRLVQNHIAALRAENERLTKSNKAHCTDWAEDDTQIKAICARHGINTDGDKWAFKGRIECLEELSQQLTQLRASLSTAVDALEAARDFVANVRSHNIPGQGEWHTYTDASFRVLRDALAQQRPLLAGKQPTSLDVLRSEYRRLCAELQSENWTAGEHANYFGFFCHGWYGRAGQSAYQQAQPPAAEVKVEEKKL